MQQYSKKSPASAELLIATKKTYFAGLAAAGVAFFAGSAFAGTAALGFI
jgi:hypothetical protein